MPVAPRAARRPTGRRPHVPVRPALALAVPLALAVVAVLLVGPGSSSRPAGAQAGSPPPYGDPPPRGAPVGETLYLRDCAVCHGVDGAGTPRGQSLKEIGPAEVDYSLTTGRMPIPEPGSDRRRREPKYSPEETKAIVDHMRPFIALEPDIPEVHPSKGDLGHGAKLYLSNCASCHQFAGSGGVLFGVESPSLEQSTPLQIAEAIRTGPVNMPEYGEELFDEHDVDSIVRYVLYLRDPEDRGGNGLWHLGPLPEGLIVWLFGMGVVILAVRWIGEKE
ncbi:MAG TPA: c-type cytochrome [Acidimicrobiales bacterium]|nr:c-type cytochrome [Acidimicrobiales bacterium]